MIQDAEQRSPEANLRKKLNAYIIRSGNATWTKPFQNLRASCETDLLSRFPIHQVTKWIGNSTAVALRHYAMVSDADIAAAAAEPAFTARCISAAQISKPGEIEAKLAETKTAPKPH